MQTRGTARPDATRSVGALPGLTLVGLALAATLAGCGMVGHDASHHPSARPSASSAPTSAPTPQDVTATVTLGDVLLRLTAAPGATFSATRDDGSTRVVVRHVDDDGVRLAVSRPSGGTLSVEVDGSVAITTRSGDVIAGVAPPRDGASATSGTVVRAKPSAGADSGSHSGSTAGSSADELALVPDSGTLTLWFGDGVPRSATWGVAEGGRSLAVDPSTWARAAGQAGADATWTALVAERPDANAPGMHDQLTCHAIGAPDKATWNLEPWRPAVGLVATLAARCNPT